jgi:histone-lysine N-methyltransferase SETD3
MQRKEEMNNKITIHPCYKNIYAFMRTLSYSGAYFPKVTIEYDITNNNRYVVAKDDIKKGEIALYVPKHSLIDLNTAASTYYGNKIVLLMAQGKLRSPKHCLLSSFLLHAQLNKDVKYKYYFDILPNDFKTFPVYYNERELSLINGTSFLKMLISKKETLLDDYNTLCNEFVSDNYKELYTYDAFVKARMIVGSRVFGVKINGKKIEVLAPFADMLNHHTKHQTTWFYNDKTQAFMIQAIDDIKKGSELYDSYGNKTNSRFLLNYGFVIEDNTQKEVEIEIDYAEHEVPLFKKKKLWMDGTFKRKFMLNDKSDSNGVVDLFSYLRFIVFDNENEVKRLYTQISKGMDFILSEDIQTYIPVFYMVRPFLIENEVMMLKELKRICEYALTMYPTTLNEDYEMLRSKEGNMTVNERNCVVIRRDEKEVLVFMIEFAEECKRIIEGVKCQQELKDMLKKKEIKEEYHGYIKSIMELFKGDNDDDNEHNNN